MNGMTDEWVVDTESPNGQGGSWMIYSKTGFVIATDIPSGEYADHIVKMHNDSLITVDDQRKSLAQSLRASARRYLGLRDGEYWDSFMAETQARDLANEGWRKVNVGREAVPGESGSVQT